VLAESEIAILDRAFARAVQQWPQLAATMLEQAVERTRMQAYLVAARGAVRVEERLLLTFWHLADRWGRVGPDGTTIEVPHLTHEMLAEVVGARRPPTTLALGRLRERGDIDRRDGLWVLRGQPPAK
jgi:CRP-like cAMP-binding protein